MEHVKDDTNVSTRNYHDSDVLCAVCVRAQITYWHISHHTGEQILISEKDGHVWIVKGRSEWLQEIRRSARQVDRASKILEDKGLIEKKKFKFGVSPTIHT